MSDVHSELDGEIARLEEIMQQISSGHPQLFECQEALGKVFWARYKESGKLEDMDNAVMNFQTVADLMPVQDPRKAGKLQTFAALLSDRYSKLGNLVDLETALQKQQEGFDLTPKGHPDKADQLQNLAALLTYQYRRLGNLNDIDAALQRTQAGLDLIPEKHPKRAGQLQTFAALLSDRYRRLGNLTDLEAGIDKQEEALDLITEQGPQKADQLQNLAVFMSDRYRRSGDLADLETALQKQQEALNLIPERHPDKADQLQTFAVLLSDRYLELGNLTDLESALQKQQKSFELMPEGHPARPNWLQNFAASLLARYHSLGDLKDLETALQKQQEALDLTPDKHPDRAARLKSLATSFINRYQVLGDLEDLEAALQRQYDALDLTHKDHPDRAGCLQNLALSLSNRFRRLGDLKDMDTALQTEEAALDLTPQGHPNRVRRLQNFATSLLDRYNQFGDLNDLEAALKKQQEALDLTPKLHTDRPDPLWNFAVTLSRRYKRLGDLRDLEVAVHKQKEALDLTPEKHPDRADRLQTLAVLLSDRYQRSGDFTDLEIALQKQQEALNLIPEKYANKSDQLHTFAMLLFQQYHKFGNLADLEIVLQTEKRAVDLTPEGHPDKPGRLRNLAAALAYRYKRLRNPSDLEDTITHYKNSFKPLSSAPQEAWTQALQWAAIAAEFQPSDCPAAYMAAFHQLPYLLWIGNSIPIRQDAIRRLNIGQVTSTATKACIDVSNLTSAIEIMEQGLATTFQQILQLKTDVDQLPSGQAQQLRKLSSDLYSRTSNDLKGAAIDRNKLIDNIRKQGLEYFLLPKPYTVLQKAAQLGPIVILNSHVDGCDGIIMLPSSSAAINVPLPTVTLQDLRYQQKMLRELLGHCNARVRDESTSTRLFARRESFTHKNTQECFKEMLAWLWTNTVSLVYEALKSHGIHNGRLWWLLTGEFTRLPLHACSPTDEYIHSYTATLGSLLEGHAKTSSSSTPVFGLVGVTHTGPSKRYFLHGVVEEVKNISGIIKQSIVNCLEGPQATADAVKPMLQNCSWVHLACHGTQDLMNPVKSCLLLYEGELDLEEVLRMPLPNAKFVFLAACQTAMGDAELVNESFHLGGGFLAAGFQGAVGTLWSMNDADGPFVADKFYSYLFRDGNQPQASDTAEALDDAVKALKAKGIPYERWIPFIHMGV